MIFPSSIGNYKLTPTTLGKGSFSKVALANHVILNKQVALKVVTLHKIKDPYVSKNLKREAAIMPKLNHPNIVPLHEVISDGDCRCLVLDFYPGGILCDMIGSQEGCLSCGLQYYLILPQCFYFVKMDYRPTNCSSLSYQSKPLLTDLGGEVRDMYVSFKHLLSLLLMIYVLLGLGVSLENIMCCSSCDCCY